MVLGRFARWLASGIGIPPHKVARSRFRLPVITIAMTMTRIIEHDRVTMYIGSCSTTVGPGSFIALEKMYYFVRPKFCQVKIFYTKFENEKNLKLSLAIFSRALVNTKNVKIRSIYSTASSFGTKIAWTITTQAI